jgi:hypothetical protein
MRARSLIFLVFILFSLALASCAIGLTSSTLAGTISKTGVADGIFGAVKLVNAGDPMTATAIYWAKSAPFSGGIASYSIAGIAPGDYSAYAFIDVNGDAAWGPSAMPDSGSWSSADSQDITITDDQSLNFPDGGFSLVH